MANHCENIIKFKGLPEAIERVASLLNEDEDGNQRKTKDLKMDCYQILPISEVENDYPENYKSHARYGTRWTDVDTWDDSSDNELELYVISAWSPPLELIQYISLRFPDTEVEVLYCETGEAFCGSMSFEAGQVTEQDDIYGSGRREDYLEFVEEHFDENIREYYE